jgi:hypothetical protein
MWPYILTFIAVAVFPLALAGYGGHLATLALPENSKARRRALVIVWSLAVSGVVLFGVSQILSYRTDKGRDGRDESFRRDVLRKLQAIIDEPNSAKRKEDAGALKASIAGKGDKSRSPDAHSGKPQLPDLKLILTYPNEPSMLIYNDSNCSGEAPKIYDDHLGRR